MDLAVCTTFHPRSKPYLDDWYASIVQQTDSKFSLWIGVHKISRNEVSSRIGSLPSAHWVVADPTDSPAQVREQTWRSLLPHADAVVMVDADDVMRPHRIEQARDNIENHDLTGCAVRLVDSEGEELSYVMPPKKYSAPEQALPNYNIFGLTNSVYRSDLLAECLPIPDNVVLVDWYLSTYSWLKGRNLYFDRDIGMKYRQYENSMLSLLPPFTFGQIQEATHIVQRHLRVLLENPPDKAEDEHWNLLVQAVNRVQTFAGYALSRPEWLRHYTQQLNQLEPLPLWWACVAHPKLESLWTKSSVSE